MQKVVGSNPISRLRRGPYLQAFFRACSRLVLLRPWVPIGDQAAPLPEERLESRSFAGVFLPTRTLDLLQVCRRSRVRPETRSHVRANASGASGATALAPPESASFHGCCLDWAGDVRPRGEAPTGEAPVGLLGEAFSLHGCCRWPRTAGFGHPPPRLGRGQRLTSTHWAATSRCLSSTAVSMSRVR
jgi:hypothetical protein